jgi:two-component system, OmpR family, phosphate regulon sensor histidine kinase PhoR
MESNPATPDAAGAPEPAKSSSREKPARLRVFLVLFLSFVAVIAATDIAVGFTVHRYWESALRAEIERSLTQKAELFASRVNTDRISKIEDITAQEGQHAGARATVIDGNGKVIADSQVPVAALENEGQRPEFATALHGDTGIETRNHNGIPVLYVAVPVSGGAVRLAYPLADVEIAAAHARQVMLLGTLVAVFAALAISALAAKTITRRRS